MNSSIVVLMAVIGCMSVSAMCTSILITKIAVEKQRIASTLVAMVGPAGVKQRTVPNAQTAPPTGGGTKPPLTTKQSGNATINDASVVNPSGAIAVAGPVTDMNKVYKVVASFYGPDEINGVHGGNDNIFEHIPAGQYTAPQLRQIGKHFVAMTEQFMKKGFMGAIIRIKGSKSSFDAVVVDLLPDRHDGKNVQVDVHGQVDWEALGGDMNIGLQPIEIRVVGHASIPVSQYSPWAPSKFGYKN